MPERFVPSTAHEPKTPFKLDPVPDGAARGWRLHVDGSPIATPASTMKLWHEKMGIRVDYGFKGYDRPVIKEAGGGGSVTIPYHVAPDGHLYIGVVREQRDLMGGMVWNAPRGFMNPGEQHFQTAVREYTEETGHHVPEQRIRELKGLPTNPNSAFFDTSGENEGVRFYAIKILQDELCAIDDDTQNPQYVFNPAQLEAVSAVAKKIMGTTFIPVEDALQLADQFTVAGVGRLFMELVLSGEIDPSIYAPKK